MDREKGTTMFYAEFCPYGIHTLSDGDAYDERQRGYQKAVALFSFPQFPQPMSYNFPDVNAVRG